MHELHKQEVHAYMHVHSITWLATLFNNVNHPYISSSKLSANWRAIATYVGMVVE